ncbi:hypothetical protein CROQUDRAFT_37062 [Cronartium quercuum f. sp. fusiforme G11]|uniref:Ribosomal protein S9 n=1 Tax=Cronartium quercuum f. sp. fusiforme G11 TaxID=708437 RepID=A0A9P6TFY6_9BASI|nr:hypothetical protein CROQUDRAFT_37062 [Cronartium quercuum f. sp. fusiforme G11]
MPSASSFKISPNNLFRSKPSIPGSRKSKVALFASFFIRQSSSFIPGRASADDKVPIVPKPPSTNWFTTHPALSDSLSFLDSLIRRTREELHDASVLKRFSAPATFAGTGVRLKWLKWRMESRLSEANAEEQAIFKVLWNPQSQWHDRFTVGMILQGSGGRELSMIEYDTALAKLNELKALKRYLVFLKTTQLSTNPNQINQLDQDLQKALLMFTKPDRMGKSIKNEEFGRDHLGRFYGVGRKKESTARVWMIEVQVPKIPSIETSNAQVASSVKDDSVPTLTSELTTTQPEPSDDLRHIPLGQIICNGRPINDYFHTPRQRATALRALEITDTLGHYNIHVLTHGGGKMGQAAAISHALANAVMNALQESAKTDSTAQERHARKVLSKSQLTLRDPRVVERKKTGKPGAKSSYRWVKR